MEEQGGLSEDQRRALEIEHRERLRTIAYNHWIARQRHITQNLRLETEGQDGPGGPAFHRFQLLHVPEGVDRVNRSLALVIEENDARFRIDFVHVHGQNLTWAIEAEWPRQ